MDFIYRHCWRKQPRMERNWGLISRFSTTKLLMCAEVVACWSWNFEVGRDFRLEMLSWLLETFVLRSIRS